MPEYSPDNEGQANLSPPDRPKVPPVLHARALPPAADEEEIFLAEAVEALEEIRIPRGEARYEPPSALAPLSPLQTASDEPVILAEAVEDPASESKAFGVTGYQSPYEPRPGPRPAPAAARQRVLSPADLRQLLLYAQIGVALAILGCFASMAFCVTYASGTAPWWCLAPMTSCILGAAALGITIEFGKVRPLPASVSALSRSGLVLVVLSILGVAGTHYYLSGLRQRHETARSSAIPQEPPRVPPPRQIDPRDKTEDWRAEGPPQPPAKEPPDAPVPTAPVWTTAALRPQFVSEPLRQWQRTEGRCQVTCFGKPEKYFRQAVWSEDGRRLFAIESGSHLVEIDTRDWTVRRRVTLGSMSGLVLRESKAGLVLLSDRTKLAVVDPRTMQARRQVDVHANVVGIAPGSSLVYAVDFGGKWCCTVDLVSQRPVRWERTAAVFGTTDPPEPLTLERRESVAITRDNRYLLWLNRDHLRRYRIQGDTLKLDAMGPRPSTSADVLEIGLDSQFAVCHGEREFLDAGAPYPEGWCVYNIADLAKPLGTIWFNGRCPPVAVDPVTRKSYVFGAKGFGAIDLRGVVDCVLPPEVTVAWSEVGGDQPLNLVQVLAHPKGRAALLLGRNTGYFIQILQDAPPKTASVPPPGQRPVELPPVSVQPLPEAEYGPANVEPETLNAPLEQWTHAADGFRLACFGKPNEILSKPVWSADGQRLFVVQQASGWRRSTCGIGPCSVACVCRGPTASPRCSDRRRDSLCRCRPAKGRV
jgi:hypothetical protein